MPRRETFDSKLALLFIDRMLAVLAEKPMNRTEMQAALFASKTKMLNYIRLLHGDLDAPKRIYIVSFDACDNGGRVPRYAPGDKPDAAPLGSRTEAERYAARKADAERHRRYLARLRAAAAAKRSRAKPTTWFAALPGASTVAKDAA